MDTNEQKGMFYNSVATSAGRAALIFDMMRSGDITRGELASLIRRRPNVYGYLQGVLDNDANWKE